MNDDRATPGPSSPIAAICDDAPGPSTEDPTPLQAPPEGSQHGAPAPAAAPPPEPDAPARETDVLDDIAAELSTRLPEVLKSWEGAQLARFEWRLRGSGQGAGRLDVALARVIPSTRAGSAQMRFELACTPRNGKAVPVSIQLQMYRRRSAGLHLRIWVYESIRDWECATVDQGVPVWNGTFPRPKGLPSLEQLAEVWLAPHSGAAEPELAVATGVESLGHPIKHKHLAELWPRYEPAAKRIDFSLAALLCKDDDPAAVITERVAAAVLVFALWNLLLRSLTVPDEVQPFDALLDASSGGLPPADAYLPRRAVDLDPSKVRDRLQQEGLVIPWHVVEAASAALNSGKHVLFTGPPGCGKSKLAGVLASLATGRDPLMTTASPAWTSGDLIGRYFPARAQAGLEFQPGFFLRALADGNRWLVIDEFNRANIDECFGELFSVLAEDIVELPFEEAIRDGNALEGDAVSHRTARVRIVPQRRARRRGEATGSSRAVSDYVVGPAFRLIGTMNDADRASLHQLSFALLRRFHIIRVEAPAPADVRRIMDQAIGNCVQDLRLTETAYRLVRRGKRMTSLSLSLDVAQKALRELFGRDAVDRRATYSDLIRERVVGLASVLDIIRFVGEGLRGPAMPGRERCDVVVELEGGGLDEHALATTLSFLALGVVLSVFPQLDALAPDARGRAVRHILDVFQPAGQPPILMRRIETTDGAAEPGFRLACIKHSEPADHDVDADTYVSIGEFLVAELCQQYRGSAEASGFLSLISPPNVPDEQ